MTGLLPPSAYLDPAHLAAERRSVFRRSWLLAGAAEELAAPGSYVTLAAGDDPLVVVRGADGRLRAFHNLCRHRGMVLLEGAGTVGRRITCPYHLWTYDDAGALRNVPQHEQEFPGLDLEACGLVPADVGEWAGLVFARAARTGTTLAEDLGDLPQLIGSFRPEALVEVARVRLDVACNWKVLIENHVDVYHLWYLHARSLADFDHGRFEHRATGPHWASYEPLKADDERRLVVGTAPIDHLDERDRSGLGAHLVFPNTMVATTEEFFATYVAVPIATDRTLLDLRVRAEAGADGEALATAVQSFLAEDVVACERVQAGLRSSAFSVTALAAHHEAPLLAFHDALRELLLR